MTDIPHIKVTLYKDDDDCCFELTVVFKNSPIKNLYISEPWSMNKNQLDALLDGKGTVGGGGNSCWGLTASNGVYSIIYDISGCGDNSSIVIELPREQTIYLLNVWRELIEKYNSKAEFVNKIKELGAEIEWVRN